MHESALYRSENRPLPIFDRFLIFWIFELSRIDDYFLELLFLFQFADKEKIYISGVYLEYHGESYI